jgi:hypothetical protein
MQIPEAPSDLLHLGFLGDQQHYSPDQMDLSLLEDLQLQYFQQYLDFLVVPDL